ncbi:hypothetical protein PGB90_001392 [Kerria lacca]
MSFFLSKISISVSALCVKNLSFTLFPVNLRIPVRHYSLDKKSAKLSGSGTKIKEFPVETDTQKLVDYCCGSNYFVTGEDIKLKPESEYPDWLWELNVGPAPKLEDLDPNSKQYWLRVRRLARRHKNKMHSLRVKVLKQF